MNAEGLLAHYARIADAPDAIARLRRFVLDLAVRGKLVAQESGDEPAAKLLERITAEKTRLIQAGTIRREKPAPPSEEAPFAIPSGWAWSQIAKIGILSPRNGAADDMQVSFVPMNLISAEYGEPNGHEIRLWREIKRGYTHFSEGDVGLAKITPCFENGKSTVFRNLAGKLGSGTTELHVVRPLLINPDYVLVFLKSPHFIESGIPRMTGTAGQKRVPTDYFAYSPFPVPPLAEQHRIVAKVDELMALCDQLEAARTEREATRDRLAAASLARLNAPDPETFDADARFALEALPSLTDRADQIKQLRRTIINLAVCGKLVPQQPDDEPAVALLERFSKAKLRRRAETNDARIKVARNPASDELDIDLPSGWAVQSFENLFLFIDYRGNTPPKTPHGVPLITAKNIRKGFLDREPREFISEATFKTWMTRGLPKIGDLFFTTEAPLANACINELDEPFALAQRSICLQPYSAINTRFLMLAILSDVMQQLIEKHATGMTAKGIKSANLKPLPLPVPPIAEQNRITAKVDELMALCDQLEASLANADDTRCRLLDALLHEALAPVAKTSKEHARAAVSGYLVSRLASKRNFGRTAHMKHLYFAESLLGLDLGGRYRREAAGPLDTGIYELEKRAEAADWYSHSVETLPSGKEKVSYQPGKALKAIAEEGITVLGSSRVEMDRLIDLMSDLKTESVEIIATLFAAWNDALLDGQIPDDDWIIKEVREHWHVSKQRFTPADLNKWLGWMRQNDVVPFGHPPRTMQQTTMEF